MKKTVKILSLILAFGACSLSAIAISGSESNKALDFFTLKDAQAKCCSTVINNGRCSFSGNCFPDAGGQAIIVTLQVDHV